MKLLQINAVFGHGSTGLIVEKIGNEAEKCGIESCVACSESLKGERRYIIGSTFDRKMHAALCRVHGKQAYFSHFATRAFLRYIDWLRPDIVHLHNLHSNYIQYKMLMRYLADKDIPTIITLHDCWYYTGKCFHYTAANCNKWKTGCGHCPKLKEDTPSYFGDFTKKICEDHISCLAAIPRLQLVGVSDWLCNEVAQSLAGNVSCCRIYNSIDTSVFLPADSRLRETYQLKDKFVILGIADKWLRKINRAVLNDFVASLNDDMVFILIGCQEKDKKKFPKNVIRIGYIREQQELAKWYSMADVFVNITREDSLPTVNIEAQACGTPVVTFAACGATETVPPAFAIKPGDVQNLVNTIKIIQLNGKSCYSQKCREWVNERFSETYGQYIQLYHDIVKRTR